MDAILGRIGHCIDQLGIHLLDGELQFVLADFGDELFLQPHQLANLFVGEGQGIDKILFGYLVRATLDTDDGVGSAANNHFEVALVLLGMGRVGDKLAIKPPHPQRAHRAGERYVGDAQRRRSTEQTKNIRIVFAIV